VSAVTPAGTGIDMPVSAPTVDATSAAESPTPSLPHERDQKVGMTGGVQSVRVQQGARDLKRGVRDTTRAPETDDAYRKLKK
jgi:hypothetical protein